MKKEIEVCARLVILDGESILVCRAKGKGHYFLPGGHVEYGEDISAALSREMVEELGVIIKKTKLIGVVDNFYTENGRKHHEINLVFSGVLKKISTESKEDHLKFSLIDFKNLSKTKVYPIALKKAISKWRKNKKIFFTTERNSQ